MKSLYFFLSALLLLAPLSACGNKGSLKSPEQIEREAAKKAQKAEKEKRKEEKKEKEKNEEKQE